MGEHRIKFLDLQHDATGPRIDCSTETERALSPDHGPHAAFEDALDLYVSIARYAEDPVRRVDEALRPEVEVMAVDPRSQTVSAAVYKGVRGVASCWYSVLHDSSAPPGGDEVRLVMLRFCTQDDALSAYTRLELAAMNAYATFAGLGANADVLGRDNALATYRLTREMGGKGLNITRIRAYT